MRTLFFLPLILLAVILTAGCQNDPYPIESGSVTLGQSSALGQFMLPAGATLQSATLYIYVYAANNQTVNIHRITVPWD
ncbi:MAG: hypothetical protein AB1483_14060, partial [Candidatus Zixiibacteriota bacterium]